MLFKQSESYQQGNISFVQFSFKLILRSKTIISVKVITNNIIIINN